MKDHNIFSLIIVLVLGTCLNAIDSNDVFCETKGCIEAANMIMGNMDNTTDPCDDFYQFACGGFVNKTVIPEGLDEVTTISKMIKNVDLQLKGLLEERIKKEELNFSKQIKTFYSTCLNQTDIERRGLKPLKTVLKELGGWPSIVTDNLSTNNPDHWSGMIIKLRKLGLYSDYLLDFTLSPNVQNTSGIIMVLRVPNFGLDNKYFKNDTILEAYLNMMKLSAFTFGAGKKKVDEMMKVLDFQKELYNISRRKFTKNGTRVDNNNLMTINNLTTLDPSINWTNLIREMINNPKVEVSGDDKILVYASNYIIELAKLINSTSPGVISNYLLWRVVQDSLINLNNQTNKLYYDFYSLIRPIRNDSERWSICLERTKTHFSLGVGSMYVRKYFNQSSSQKAETLVDNLKQQFNETLSNVTWMDSETKRRAIKKLELMKKYIGFSSDLLNDTLLEDYYRDLDLNKFRYYENIRNLTYFKMNKFFSIYGQLIARADWTLYKNPFEVNAFYDYLTNAVSFPAGLLQSIYFSADRPNYLNYGAFGYSAGDQIGHGYDFFGQFFNETGGSESWWNQTTAEVFLNLTECLIYQYGNYTIPQLNISWNSLLTNDEDITDNIGIKMAYNAYERSIANKTKEEGLLKGLNYTQAQLFWISSANALCGKVQPDVLEERIQSNSYSPNMFRIIGPLSNRPEFAKDFKCSQPSKMNPENKCQLY